MENNPPISLEKLPNSSDLHIWSDYIELLCLINKDGLINKADIIDRLLEGMDIDLSVEQQEDLEKERTTDIRMNKLELKASDWFRQLEYRAGVFGKSDFYPFELSSDGNTLSTKNQLDIKHQLYLILLLGSNLHYVPDLKVSITKDFETISELALKKCLPQHAEVYIFGTGGSSTSKKISGNLFTKIETLAHLLHEKSLADPVNFSPHDVGDGGLDIVGWVPMGDQAGGTICVFGQCACTTEWVSKQHSSSYSSWRNKIFLIAPPNNAVFIPFCFRDNNGFWWNSDDIHETIVFDRVRLVTLLQDAYDSLKNLPVLPRLGTVISYRESLV